jgi:hypothetical protein
LIDQNTAQAFRLVNDIAQAGMAQIPASATASFSTSPSSSLWSSATPWPAAPCWPRSLWARG